MNKKKLPAHRFGQGEITGIVEKRDFYDPMTEGEKHERFECEAGSAGDRRKVP